MGYFNLGKIKRILSLDADEHDEDTVVNGYGVDADDYINTQLGVHMTTPMVNPDDQIRRLSERLGASWYVYWNSPSHPMQGVKDTKEEIDTFIQATYAKQSGGLMDNSFTKTNSGITGFES